MEDLFREVLKTFEDLGLWRDGVELIGSWSFLLYQRHLGVRPLPLRTQDIDFLLPWPYPHREMVSLSEGLAKLGFRSAAAANGSMFFVHPELKLDFLIPERGRGGLDYRLVKPLGIRAVPLRFMDMLLKDSIVILDGGLPVRVPKPVNFCLHKLLIAHGRAKKDKSLKDLEQAVYVLGILEAAEFKKALSRNPNKWRRLIIKSLGAAWELFPLERSTIEKLDLAPRK